MPSLAGTFMLSCLVPSGPSREFFAKSPGCKKPHDSLKEKTEAGSRGAFAEWEKTIGKEEEREYIP